MLKKILFLLFILFTNIQVKAICSNEEYKILNAKAKKIEFSVDYVLETFSEASWNDITQAIYTITAHNLDSDLLVQAETSYGDIRTFKYNKNKTSSLGNYYNGGNVRIKIIGNTKTCDMLLRVETIELLYYNNLYGSETCLEYPLFKYCQNQFEKVNVFNLDIEKELAKHKEELSAKEPGGSGNEKNFFEERIVAISVISLVLLTLITLIIIRIRVIVKRRSL